LVEIRINFLKHKARLILIKAAALEYLSNHMSTLLVSRKPTYISLQRLLDEFFFLIHRYVIKNRLNRMGALFMAANVDEVGLN